MGPRPQIFRAAAVAAALTIALACGLEGVNVQYEAAPMEDFHRIVPAGRTKGLKLDTDGRGALVGYVIGGHCGQHRDLRRVTAAHARDHVRLVLHFPGWRRVNAPPGVLSTDCADGLIGLIHVSLPRQIQGREIKVEIVEEEPRVVNVPPNSPLQPTADLASLGPAAAERPIRCTDQRAA